MTDPELPGLPGLPGEDDLDDGGELGDGDGFGDGASGGGDRSLDGTGLPDAEFSEGGFSGAGAGGLGRDDGGLWATAADDRARAEAFERRLVDLEDRLDAAAEAAAEPAAAEPAAGVVKAPTYEALAEFVKEEFCPRYTRRRHGGRWRWCPQWWEHSEAVSRLDALHKAWEAMHDDGPNGMGDWYRNHLDHQLPILMGADGPFRRCGNQHYPADPDDDLGTGTPPADNMAWRNA